MKSAVMTQETCQRLDSQSEQTKQAMNLLYEHFLTCVQTESASQVLGRFRVLLTETENYPDSKIQEILTNLTHSQQTQLDYHAFLNRCCQCFISHWLMESNNQSTVLELLALFPNLPSPDKRTHRLAKSWQQWGKTFAKTPQYLKFQRLVRVIDPRLLSNAPKPQQLGDLLGRYPFLYKHCLLDENNIKDYRRCLSHLKTHRQFMFGKALGRSVTLLNQKLQVAHLRQTIPETTFQSIKNPTLLNSREFMIAVEQLTELTQGKRSQQCLVNLNQMINEIPSLNFKEFKGWLVHYLFENDHELSEKQKLNQLLIDKTLQIFPHCDSQPVNEFLILRTCTQLLTELTVDSTQGFNHLTLISLRTGLGATKIASLLWKLVLICPKLKSRLSYRLAQLFEYYESTPLEQSLWLIKVLENFAIVFSLWEKTQEKNKNNQRRDF